MPGSHVGVIINGVTHPSPMTIRAGLAAIRTTHFGVAGALPDDRDDLVVVEEPLEIRVNGEPLAVTMRTPGHDHELAIGFLLAEGLIASSDDLGTVRVCGRPGDEGYGNTIDVAPAPGMSFDVERAESARRATLTTAACGVCGRRSIEDLLQRCQPLVDATRFSPALVRGLTQALRSQQPNFQKTGGLHAAGLAGSDGTYRIVREDVGRHNAVDKVLGRCLLDGRIPLTSEILVVSGRTSFEIVQKALTARVPAIVGVSAPSSLAVATARRANMTLIGFARGDSFNVYAGELEPISLK